MGTWSGLILHPQEIHKALEYIVASFRNDFKIKASVEEIGGEHHCDGNGTGRMVWKMKPRGY